MKFTTRRILTIIGLSVGAIMTLIVILAVGLSYYITTPGGQQHLQKIALKELSRQLNTNLDIDSVGVEFSDGSIALYGVNIDDQDGERMLHVDTLYGKVDLFGLLRSHIDVVAFRLEGAKANLNKKDKDSRPNFDFLIQAITNNDEDEEDEDKQQNVTFDIGEIKVENIVVNWSVLSDSSTSVEASILKAIYDGRNQKLHINQMEALQMGENGISIADVSVNVLKKEIHANGIRGKYKDMRLRVDRAYIKELEDERRLIQLDSIHFRNDNGKPRKNEGKPYRGAFDAGHMNVSANLRILADVLEKDSVSLFVDKLEAIDYASGLIVDSLSFAVTSDLKTASIKDFFVRDGQTEIAIPTISLTLPSSKEGEERQLAYKANDVQGYTVLKDISVPFAPPLANFTTPLHFSAAAIDGDDNNMRFHQVHAWSVYNEFTADADGYIANLSKGKELAVHFDIHDSRIKKDFKNKVTRHFKFKEGMVKIVENTGNLRYKGALDVKYKWIGMNGKLLIPKASINFEFGLNSETQYIDGRAHIDSLHLGELIGSKNVKNICLDAKFHFDTAGRRAAERLGRKKGKLPAGKIEGICPEAEYKSFKLKNTKFDITSDGDKAEGTLDMKGAFIDVSARFWFVNTDLEKSLKVKPKIRIHGLSKEARQARKQRKEEKKKLKAESKKKKKEEKL